MPFYDNLDVLDYLHEKFETNKTTLGMQYVAYAEEELVPKYPAIVLGSGAVQREIHTTHFFRNDVTVDIFVLHGSLVVGKKARTREDLLFVRAVVDLLHLDPTLGGNIIFSFVQTEAPGEIMMGKGEAVVSTLMTWTGQLREPFRRPA